MIPEREVWSLKEAATFLGRSPQVLRRNIKKWGVPYKRYGSKGPYVFTKEALLAYLANRQTPSMEEQCLGSDLSSTRGKEVVIGTYQDYAKALGLKIEKRPKPLQPR